MDDLTTRLASLAKNSMPPFDRALEEAVADAVRRGRRRRARTLASRAGAVMVTVALLGGALYATIPQAHRSGRTPVPILTAGTDVWADGDFRTGIARQIVPPADRGAARTADDGSIVVNGPHGPYAVAVQVTDSGSPFSACPDPGIGAGGIMAQSDVDVATSTTDRGSGRVDLCYAVRTVVAPDRVVIVRVTNVVEGMTQIGPAWKVAGVTVQRIRDVLAATGRFGALPSTPGGPNVVEAPGTATQSGAPLPSR